MKRPAQFDDDPDVEPLSKAQIHELERRVKDARDPTRYLIVSQVTERFVFYYNVSDDVYAMDREGGSLFKRRQAAAAIAALLRDGVRIIRVGNPRVSKSRLQSGRSASRGRKSSKARNARA